MSSCIRCWWCTCNWSCTCTPQEIRQWKIDHWYKLKAETNTITPDSVGKEMLGLDEKDYEWLAKDDAIALFFKQTGKVAISQSELKKILSFTKMPQNDD